MAQRPRSYTAQPSPTGTRVVMELTITLKAENASDDDIMQESGSVSSGANGNNGDTGGTGSGTAKKSKARAIGAMIGSDVANQLLNEAEYQINYMFAKNDDYIGQRNFSIAKQAISKTSSFVSSIATGTMVGGWLGALVGAGIQVANDVQNGMHAKEQQEFQLRQMQEQLEFTQKRSGAYDGTGFATKAGSIGEDL